LIGLEEKDYHAFDLLMEHTLDMYRIKEENTDTNGNHAQYNTRRGFNQGNRENLAGAEVEEDADQLFVITVTNLDTWPKISRTCVPRAHIAKNCIMQHKIVPN
jgi:hypothetical protein